MTRSTSRRNDHSGGHSKNGSVASPATSLSEADTCAVFQVVLETLDVGFDPIGWRKTMLGGLRRIVGAGMCLSTIMSIDPSRVDDPNRPLMVAETSGPGEADQYTNWLKRYDFARDPITPHIRANWPQPLTVPFGAMIPRKTWLGDAYVKHVYLGVGIHEVIHSRVPIFEIGYVSTLAITRGKADALFTERERRMIELAHTQVAARIAVPPAEANDAYRALPARLQELATHLRGPMSVKQIAATMRLSSYTINNYTKSIYKRLGVSSRTEIIHLMKGRDGRSAMRNELVLS